MTVQFANKSYEPTNQNLTAVGGRPSEWELVSFDVVLSRVSHPARRLKTSEYKSLGAIPIVDQGAEALVGYTDDEQTRVRCPSGGLIVFGDHTCILKYVDFDFAVGADGTQLIVARDGRQTKFFYYLLQSDPVSSTGYDRHYKFLQEKRYVVPSLLSERIGIAEALSDADSSIDSLESLLLKKRAIKQGAMQELLSGRRRLSGFNAEWRQVRLGQTGEFSKGSGVKKDEANSGSLPCVRYGELYTTHHDIIREFYSWISPEVAATARKVKHGDILFAGSGETKEEIGKCAAVSGGVEAYAGGDIIVFRSSSDDSAFLGYYLNAPEIQRQKASKGQGDAVVHISAAALAAIDLRLPSKPEQSAIAGVLSEMDDEIAMLDRRLIKAREIKQGMMQDLLTGRVRLK